jgi:hypothetical protein
VRSEHLKQPDILLEQLLLQKVVEHMVAVYLTDLASSRDSHNLIIYPKQRSCHPGRDSSQNPAAGARFGYLRWARPPSRMLTCVAFNLHPGRQAIQAGREHPFRQTWHRLSVLWHELAPLAADSEAAR